MQIILHNAKELAALRYKSLKEYRYHSKKAFGQFLFKVKRNSLNHIRENPNRLGYRELPSLPNKLTHRTGTLKRGIKEGQRSERSEDAWDHIKRKTSNTNRAIWKTFFGKMTLKETGDLVGSWSIYVRDGSAALHHNWRVRADKESESYEKGVKTAKQRIAMRMQHEHKGRPYLSPAFRQTQPLWPVIARREFAVWYNKVNKGV